MSQVSVTTIKPVSKMTARGRPGNGQNATCKRILRAARHEIACKGVRKMTIRGIAGEAGVSPGLIIQYFQSRAGLIHQLFMENNKPLDNYLASHLDQFKSPQQMVMGAVHEMLGRDLKEPEITRQVMGYTWTWGAEEENEHMPYLKQLGDILASSLMEKFYPGEETLTQTAALAIANAYVGVLRIGVQKEWPLETCEKLILPPAKMILAGLEAQIALKET